MKDQDMPQSWAQSCRWVPWAIAGAFAVVIAANGTLAYFAARSSTGLVTEHAFDKGNDYNHVLAAAQREDALGWHGNIALQSTPVGPRDLVFAITDAAGQPLEGLQVAARILRPVEPMRPIEIDLHAIAPGSYRTSLELPKAGQWEVHVTARRGDDLYETTGRVIAK